MPIFPPKIPTPSLTSSLTDPLNLSKMGVGKTNSRNEQFNQNLLYYINPSAWYETYPFSFDLKIAGSQNLKCRFFLPIPPQNYTIQDMSAAEAHATMGGVVEEVNSPVFSMITLVGTTGLSLKSPNLGNGVDKDLLTSGRKYLDELENSKLGKIVKNIGLSFIDNVLLEQEDTLQYQDGPSAVNTPANSVITNLFDKAVVDSGGLLDKFVKGVEQTINGQDIPSNEFTNGWAWSQALRQFFLIYQRERSKNTDLELYFVDHKSRASYRCIPRSVQFQQNSNSPFLINYTIILKCWEIKDVIDVSAQAKSINRFKSDLKEVNTASITGIVSKVGKICNSINRTPSIAGSFVRNSVGSIL